jgi:hypothetical protein
LARIGRQVESFAYQGVIDGSAGFEAAAFVDATTVVAKRGDSLIVLQAAM